jgi:phosphoglycolate phosphatase-like HAD superfamily hydrolase
MHITSRSDQEELKSICKALDIDQLFVSIHGSPKPKTIWVKELMDLYGYNPSECVLIGDSVNDWEAAMDNGIEFIGYNNEDLKSISSKNILFSNFF